MPISPEQFMRRGAIGGITKFRCVGAEASPIIGRPVIDLEGQTEFLARNNFSRTCEKRNLDVVGMKPGSLRFSHGPAFRSIRAKFLAIEAKHAVIWKQQRIAGAMGQ